MTDILDFAIKLIDILFQSIINKLILFLVIHNLLSSVINGFYTLRPSVQTLLEVLFNKNVFLPWSSGICYDKIPWRILIIFLTLKRIKYDFAREVYILEILHKTLHIRSYIISLRAQRESDDKIIQTLKSNKLNKK